MEETKPSKITLMNLCPDTTAEIFSYLTAYTQLLRLVCKDSRVLKIDQRGRGICSTLALCGDFETLKWAYLRGFPLDERVRGQITHNNVIVSAVHGQVKYSAMVSAIHSGHLDIVKWLRQNGCIVPRWAVFTAKGSGYVDLLQWLLCNGSPCDSINATHAVERGIF